MISLRSFAAIAWAAAAMTLAGCAGLSIPPKPEIRASSSPAVKALKLRVAPVTGSGGLAEELSPLLREPLEAALGDAGIGLSAGSAPADGALKVTIQSFNMVSTPCRATLELHDLSGTGVDKVEFVGGTIGSNLHRSAANYKAIADGIAANLVARLLDSPKFAAFADGRAKSK